MTRNRAEDTRRLLISVGLRLLHERGPSAAVGHIRLSSVLRRAGLTTGAAYRIWDDQIAYQRDLALEAMRFRDHVSNEGTVAAVVPAILDPSGSWHEAIRHGAEVNLRSYPEDVAFLTSPSVHVPTTTPSSSRPASSVTRRRWPPTASCTTRFCAGAGGGCARGSPSTILRQRWRRSRRGSGCRTLRGCRTRGCNSMRRRTARVTGSGRCSRCVRSLSANG